MAPSTSTATAPLAAADHTPHSSSASDRICSAPRIDSLPSARMAQPGQQRMEGEEESLESLAARTTDVYDQLLLREIPNRDAEFNCGRSYLDSDRPDLAEEVFRRCIEAGYKPVDSRFRLAQSLAGQHRHTEAKREIIMVLQDDPEHEEAIEWYHEFQEHVNREGKIAIYGLIGLAAFGTLIYAWMRSRRTQP